MCKKLYNHNLNVRFTPTCNSFKIYNSEIPLVRDTEMEFLRIDWCMQRTVYIMQQCKSTGSFVRNSIFLAPTRPNVYKQLYK